MFNGSELALRSTTYTYEARATDLGVGQGRKLFDTRVRLRARLTDFWATVATSSSMFVGNGTLQCQCDRISSLVSSAMSAVALGIDFWCFMAHGCLFYPQAMNHASHALAFLLAFASLHINSTRMCWRLYSCFPNTFISQCPLFVCKCLRLLPLLPRKLSGCHRTPMAPTLPPKSTL